jgi:hypothetical protein
MRTKKTKAMEWRLQGDRGKRAPNLRIAEILLGSPITFRISSSHAHGGEKWQSVDGIVEIGVAVGAEGGAPAGFALGKSSACRQTNNGK